MGPKRLYVLRHAKSSWDDPLLTDHDRPLSPRGHRATRLLAEHFRAAAIEPGYILCSSARRTQETLEGVLGDVPAVVEPALYGASARQLIAHLHRVPDEVESVLLVGHNPGAQTLVLTLTDPPRTCAAPAETGSARDEIEAKFPTGALATVEFDGPWSTLTRGHARLTAYVRPNSLP